MSNQASFFDELKRRNVIRAAGLYLVGAWLLIQIASTMLPAFDAPSWVLRSLIVTLAVCFIPGLIFSWVFELTPQGLKRDEDVRPEESIAPQTARRMDRLIIVVLVLALGYFCFDAQRAITLRPESKDAYVGPTGEDTLARIQAHFGDKDNAIAALQHLLSISYGPLPVTPALLRLDPDWDNLRGEPRFEKLAAGKP